MSVCVSLCVFVSQSSHQKGHPISVPTAYLVYCLCADICNLRGPDSLVKYEHSSVDQRLLPHAFSSSF